MKVAEVRKRCQGVLDALSQIVVGKDRVLRQISWPTAISSSRTIRASPRP